MIELLASSLACALPKDKANSVSDNGSRSTMDNDSSTADVAFGNMTNSTLWAATTDTEYMPLEGEETRDATRNEEQEDDWRTEVA